MPNLSLVAALWVAARRRLLTLIPLLVALPLLLVGAARADTRLGVINPPGGRQLSPAAYLATYATTTAAANLVSNLNATTLSLSDGTAVAPWVDPQGNTWSSFGVGSPTYTSTGFSGGPGVTFTAGAGFNTGTSLKCDALSTVGANGGSFSVFGYVIPAIGTADQYVFGLSTGSTTPLRYVGYSVSGSTWSATGSMGVVAGTATPTVQPQGGQATYGFSYAPDFTSEPEWFVWDSNGYQSGIWVSGSYLPTPQKGDETAAYSKLVWGGLNYNGNLHPSSASWTSRDLRIYSVPLGRRGVGALVYALGLQSVTRVFNTALGDSILAGFGGVTSWYSTSLLPITGYDVLPNAFTGTVTRSFISNQGTASRTIWPTSAGGASPSNSLVQSSLAAITPFFVSTMPCMVIITAGSNDIYLGGGSVTGAQVIGYLQSFHAQLKGIAPHCYIVDATLLNRGNWNTAANYSGSDIAYNTALSNYNALLRAQYVSIGADALLEFNTISGLTNAGTSASPGPNYQDACHPTQTGQNLIAAYVSGVWSTLRAAAVNKWAYYMMQNSIAGGLPENDNGAPAAVAALVAGAVLAQRYRQKKAA